MKYAFYTIAALLAAAGLGFLLMKLVTGKKEVKKGKKVLLSCLFTLLVILAASLAYLLPYQKAKEDALRELVSTETVSYEEEKNYYAFLSGSEKAFIFYPGAKVDETAYAPLMKKIAEEGFDVYVMKMPFHMAFFGISSADSVIDAHDYESVALGGHSLGGAMASSYAVSHPKKVDSLILLASYPTSKIPDSISLLSIYGSEDGCLNMENYENNKVYWPRDYFEEILGGGNHAHFASYGEQQGDGEATISSEEQVKMTAEAIVSFLEKR